MPLIRFIKPSTFAPFGKAYRYEKDVVYDVIDGLAVKFCSQMGVAVLVESGEDAGEVQPNPSAEIYDSEGCVIRPGATPTPAPEAAPEPAVETSEEVTDEAAAPRYELKGRGGPWFILVDTSTGEELPGKPMRKRDAERKIDELANQDIQSAAE